MALQPYWRALKLLPDEDALCRFMTLLSFDASLGKQPVCYMYGVEKNTHFHTTSQLEKLRGTPSYEVRTVENVGHLADKHAPDVCHAVMRKFISGADK